MANYIYYENAQIPIFSAMIVLLWTIVSVRIWVYLKTFCGWRSFRGASTIAIAITAFLCTVYYGLLLAIYFMNNDMLKVRKQPRPGEPYPAGGYEFRDPANYSDAEVDKFIEQMDRLIKVIYSARMILTIGLWLIKFSFLFIFLETIKALSRRWRYFLHATSLLITATLLIAIWSVAKDLAKGIWELVPTPDLVRNGVVYRGGRFIFFDFDVELTLTLTNIVTDICLCMIAFQTVRSFRLPLRAVLFPCCLISAGILVAHGRLALIIITRNAPNYTSYATIPFELFAELETFLSVFVACIPGLRVFMRRRQEMGWRRKSAALGAGESGFGAPVGEMTVMDSRDGRRTSKGLGLDLEEMPVSPRGSVVSRPWGPINSNNNSRTPTAERIRSDGAVFLSGEEFLR